MRLGCAALALLLWSLAASPVEAASVERLVMPGPLIEGHAKLEADCANCHVSFERGAQSSRCLDCHKDIAHDVDEKAGFHGRLAASGSAPCQSCHTDHKGRDAKIVHLSVESFDHDMTRFPLRGGHVGVACSVCHEQGKSSREGALPKYRDAPTECAGCHEKDEPHRGRLGDQCQSCHDVKAWSTVRFDHAKTHFPLTGAHVKVECAACHVNEAWKGIDGSCASCHALDDVHKGTRGDDCARCHDTKRWKVERFDHFAKTGFALDGKHADIDCAACHLKEMARPKPPKTCIGCHSVDDKHAGRNGTDCAHCHTESSWKDVTFDHEREGHFPLRGAHAKIACAACHVGALQDKIPDTCDECHAKDDPHGGTLAQCGRCHSESSWQSVATFNHDLTEFPLIGQHRTAACESCHASTTFKTVESGCASCHKADDHHKGALGDDCGACHNPNSWTRWEFDHNLQTRFILDGAHRGLGCDACHRPDGPAPSKLSTVCVSCHRKDDTHEGRFGSDCAHCHTTKSFADLERFN